MNASQGLVNRCVNGIRRRSPFERGCAVALHPHTVRQHRCPQQFGGIEAAEGPLGHLGEFPDQRGGGLDPLVPFAGGRPQPDRRERRLDHIHSQSAKQTSPNSRRWRLRQRRPHRQSRQAGCKFVPLEEARMPRKKGLLNGRVEWPQEGRQRISAGTFSGHLEDARKGVLQQADPCHHRKTAKGRSLLSASHRQALIAQATGLTPSPEPGTTRP